MTHGPRLVLMAAFCGALAAALVTLPTSWRLRTEPTALAARAHALPPPAQLLLPPGFSIKREHPRLPVPTRFGPRAFPPIGDPQNLGMPPLTLLIHAALQDPRPEALGRLHDLLMRLRPGGRGAEHAKILATAYDWLHARWSPVQRQALLMKTLDACEYEIALIRIEKLSPYNALLYNGVLQGLLSCALAVYPDHPRATPIMAFAQDLWVNRTLPVWRQVMGHAGGWHEGGDYGSTGIGQAVYQMPNLWRQATGEDLFRSEPGLRGYLDFLLHQLQPDGRPVPLGDVAGAEAPSPDAIALALETRHAAAYWSLMNAQVNEPTSWPAGPAPDVSLRDMTAVARLPLSKLFDGIGTMFARSDWTADATHVSFRAGDNYWSYTHLDQGAFTIYKGGNLALDSGLYHRMSSDHRMNYTAQSVAHNTLTFTDPEDTVPAPARHRTWPRPRPIANDGGQRRIGSGWGVEEAPLDLDEWQDRYATYHTATLEAFLEADGITVAVADITPAYTNYLSGSGEFSSRTRRVERFWRVFAYDRIADIVVVFDNTESTRPDFQKRWLLHSQEAPRIDPGGFLVRAPADAERGHAGSTLRGWVLLPEQAGMETIGGPGREFWVDGRNYDDRGHARRMLSRLPSSRSPVGAWRLEVTPSSARTEDLFLVVMAPALDASPAHHEVKLLRHGNLVGAQVHSAGRSTRWWYSPTRNGVWVDVTDMTGTRRHMVAGTSRAGRPLALQWLRDVFGL